MKKNKVEKISVNLCKSKNSGKLYIGLFQRGKPLKFWDYEEMSDAGKDFFKELVKIYDLAYDKEFQFPQKIRSEKKLVPYVVDMIGEPGYEDNPKNQQKEKFVFFNLKTGKFSDIKERDYDIPVTEDDIIEIKEDDPKANEFLANYISEKNL